DIIFASLVKMKKVRTRKMIKKINVTCEKCKDSFIFTSESSVVDKVLDKGHYICFTCEDEKSEDTKND
ncbi:MAG: hypothetical protein L0K19_10580, partial [Lactococcus lactis]|nr:hypothetical protein [Lactococcus lactis]